MNIVVPDPFSLPMSLLAPVDFVPFLREVEKLALLDGLQPVFVYWSTRSAFRLLPSKTRFRELMRDAKAVSIFSEDRLDAPDEWCFLVESQCLCLSLHGQQTLKHSDGERYQCFGSMDSTLVAESFLRLKPKWLQLDEGECNRLDDVRSLSGFAARCDTSADSAEALLRLWPISFEPDSD